MRRAWRDHRARLRLGGSPGRWDRDGPGGGSADFGTLAQWRWWRCGQGGEGTRTESSEERVVWPRRSRGSVSTLPSLFLFLLRRFLTLALFSTASEVTYPFPSLCLASLS